VVVPKEFITAGERQVQNEQAEEKEILRKANKGTQGF
jgi:hypothetical protein